MPPSHLILCRPLLLLPPIPPSIRVFSNESTLRMRWPKYWSFSFRISLSNEHPGLISFRMDWLDLAVQGTLKSFLQHHSSKASILRCSAFFLLIFKSDLRIHFKLAFLQCSDVQLSHPYMITGETIALTRWTFVGKVMSLLFNMLSSFYHPPLKEKRNKQTNKQMNKQKTTSIPPSLPTVHVPGLLSRLPDPSHIHVSGLLNS